MSNTDLSQLTKEQFNTLYPVELVDYNPNWVRLFDAEKAMILSAVDSNLLGRIEHFGSTSIPGIKAKPYIDILIEIDESMLFNEGLIDQFKPIGYQHWKVPERDGIAAYMSFGKGYYNDGTTAQIFHIHMCPANNFMWKQIAFRDYLIAHPERAQAYESLKTDLAAKHKNDRGAYVLGKTDFVVETLAMIKDQ
ncbi:MAG: GrpB family protein [Cytophagales bacterium]|nr:GrpB family protein [Cytophagales bacterium]